MEQVDIAIIGSGPSGVATALSLLRIDPDLASRTLVLEKSRHPRPKLCGGGVTFTARPTLDFIGIPLDSIDVPHVRVDRVNARFEDRVRTVRYKDAFRILRRDEFDAELVRRARDKGIEIREGSPVKDIAADPEGVTLTLPGGPVRARVVVGADGAKSLVRRKMDLPDPSRVSRLIEILTPQDPQTTVEFTQNAATFDFSPCRQGVQGYYWDFPSFKGGAAFMNRGVFDSRVLPHKPLADLKDALSAQLRLRDIDLDDHDIEGHPERWFDPRARLSRPHMILVGDAAGVEPLLGEGIAYALMYGPAVAPILSDAFKKGDLSFSDYERRLLKSPVGRHLRLRTRLARIAYNTPPSLMRALMPLTPLAAAFIASRCSGAV